MAVALLVVAWDLQISRIEAGVLFVLLVGYVVQVLTMARRGRIDPAQDIELAPPIAAVPHGTAQEPLPGSFAAEHPQEVRAGRSDPPGPQDAEHGKGPADTLAPAAAAGLVVAGVVLLVVGSSLLVEGARTVAESFGVSELVIGLTVVAIGTSLPELATSMLAAVRGERDLAVGNVVGSNIFNVGAVLGISGLLAGPLPVPPSAVALDIPLVILSGLILLPLALTSSSIGRLEGALLVAGYLAYTLYLYLDASGHERLEPFSALMLQVVIPTVLVIIAVGYLADRRRPR
jgi:cation:H+ antiporter